MQGGPSAFGGLGTNCHAGSRVGRRHRRQPLQQRAEVQPGAACQDRHASARDDVGHHAGGINGEFRR